jgi:hypothetical protein
MDHVFMAASPLSLNITSATIRTLSNASVAYKNFKGSQLRALTGLEFSSSAADQEASGRLGGSLSKLQQLVATAAAAKPPSESYSTTVAGGSFPSNTTRCSSSSNNNSSSSSQYSASVKTNATGVEIRAPTSSTPSPSESEPVSPGAATRWRELHGSNYWKGLLDPLDADLRSELIRYGEFSQVTYDSFDHDTHSIFYGSNRYRKDKLFEKVKHLNTGYEVTHYIYATADLSMPNLLSLCKAPDAWSKNSNWMGYVAVCTDEEKIKLGRRDILIAWRGTIMNTEWAANAQINLVPSGIDSRHSYNLTTAALRVEMGFLNLYTSKNSETRYNKTSARQQVLTELKRLIQKYKGDELSITVTGHSLGSALATLNAYDIAQSGFNRITDPAAAGAGNNNSAADWYDSHPIPENWGDKTADPVRPDKEATIPIAVMSFAGPRVGNNAFCNQLNALGVKVLRVVNVNDIVPRVPGNLFPPQLGFIDKLIDLLPFTYSHAGVQLLVNNFDSPSLDPERSNIFNCHNLEGYLHLVFGHQGSDGLVKKQKNSASFTSPLSRDIALVNKSSDFLKDGHFIPDNWWQIENKGLVYVDGKWVPETRDAEDVPVPPVSHKKST